MDERKLEDMIQRALTEGTESSLELKDKVWSSIQGHIKQSRRGLSRMERKKRRNRRPIWLGGLSVAAALVLVFLMNTEAVLAGVNKIRELLAPEKVIVEELEGQKEETNVSLQESQVGYVIYFDKGRYRMEKLEDRDRIVATFEGAEDFPDVYMEIRQLADQKPESLVSSLEKQLSSKKPKTLRKEKVEDPVKGTRLTVVWGQNWNSVYEKYYVISNGKEGSFLFHQKFFFEAAEGHGVRFDNMLREFKLIDEVK
ncbi:MAG: hypothetical protein ACOX6S_14040 [Clostridia bacterium]|jgi:hypothetical protein